MYTPPWIPRADGAFRKFAGNFCKNISDHPAGYMMTAAEAAWLMRLFDEFDAAYKAAVEPITRTRSTIANKDDARSILQNSIESYGAFIRINKGITDGEKLAIGVRPRNVSHRERKCPNTAPLLNYIGSTPGMDELRYHDANTPTSKAKPYGAERLMLWGAYTLPGEPRPKREDARPIGTFTKSKMIVPQDPQRDIRLGAAGPGTGLPTYWAQWLGHDGGTSPWSLALSVSSRHGESKPQAAQSSSGNDADDQQQQQQKQQEQQEQQQMKRAA